MPAIVPAMAAHYDQLIQRLAAVLPVTNRISRADLFDLIRAIEVLAIERPNPDQLWTIYRVASHLGLDPVIAERLLAAPGAPQPMTGDDAEVRRAKDIYRWLDGHGRANLKAVADAAPQKP